MSNKEIYEEEEIKKFFSEKEHFLRKYYDIKFKGLKNAPIAYSSYLNILYLQMIQREKLKDFFIHFLKSDFELSNQLKLPQGSYKLETNLLFLNENQIENFKSIEPIIVEGIFELNSINRLYSEITALTIFANKRIDEISKLYDIPLQNITYILSHSHSFLTGYLSKHSNFEKRLLNFNQYQFDENKLLSTDSESEVNLMVSVLEYLTSTISEMEEEIRLINSKMREMNAQLNNKIN